MFTGGIGSSNPPFATKKQESKWTPVFFVTNVANEPETPRSGGEGASDRAA